MQSAEDCAVTAYPCWEGNKTEGKGHQGTCSHPLFISASPCSPMTSPTQLGCLELAWSKAEPEPGEAQLAPWGPKAAGTPKQARASQPRAQPVQSWCRGIGMGTQVVVCTPTLFRDHSSPGTAILCSSSPGSNLEMSLVESRWLFFHLLPGTQPHAHQGAERLAGQARV